MKKRFVTILGSLCLAITLSCIITCNYPSAQFEEAHRNADGNWEVTSSNGYTTGTYVIENSQNETLQEAKHRQIQTDLAAIRAEFADEDSSGSSSSTTSSSKSRKTSSGPTLSEYSESDYAPYVVISKKAVYDTYKSGRTEIGSIAKDTEVTVTGKSSNGYYRIQFTPEDSDDSEATDDAVSSEDSGDADTADTSDTAEVADSTEATDDSDDTAEVTEGYLLYEGKDNIVTKEEYDNAWSETNHVDPTCTEPGYSELTNSLSGKVVQWPIEATGHTEGDEKVTTEQGLLTPGVISTYCATCGEVISTEEIPQIIPMWAAIVFCCVIIADIIIAIIIIKNVKRKKNNA